MNKIKVLKILKNLYKYDRYHSSEGMDNAIQYLTEQYKGIVDSYNNNLNTTWELPSKYKVHNASILDEDGKLISDYSRSRLFLWSFSESFKGLVTYEELMKHLIFDKERPDDYLFHFRNQYRLWEKQWGISLPFNEVLKLKKNKKYFVDINTSFTKSNLNQFILGEIKSKNNLILVAHLDHPDQLNDGLSSCVAINEIFNSISSTLKNLNLCVLNSVEIIGSVFFAKRYKVNNKNTIGVINVNGAGIDSPLELCFGSLNKDSQIDKLISLFGKLHKDYFPTIKGFREGWGNDEISFQAPGVNVPAISIYRWPFAEYHTSSDNFNSFSFNKFKETSAMIIKFIKTIDFNYKILEIYIDHLPCLSHPNINLYLNTRYASDIADNQNQINSFASLDDLDIDFINKNPIFLNHFMNKFIAFLPFMPNKTIIDIASELDAPPSLVYEYSLRFEKLGFIKISSKINS